MLSLTLALAAAAACAAGATALLAWKRRHEQDTVRQILRLAAEIEAVAATVETDLDAPGDEPPCVVLRQRCRAARERAAEALAQATALPEKDQEALITTLLLLHDDHRHIVDLRSDVDRALSRSRRDTAEDRSRIINIGRPKSSAWPTSSLLTRPSTFG